MNIGGDVIYYTSVNGSKISPYEGSLGTSIVSNTYYKTGGEIVCKGKVLIIGENAFDYQLNLKTITIPRNVIEIAAFAFRGCHNLTSVPIPDSVTTIGEGAFEYCSSLKEFKGKFAADNGRCLIKDNTIIAYANASGTTYTIPDSVTEIGYGAFNYCGSLISIYCKATTPPTLGNVVFNHAKGRKIYVPYQSLDAYKTAAKWSKYADAIVGYDCENDTVVGGGVNK